MFPVRYTLSAGQLFFALSVGQLAMALDGAVVAVQADGFDEDSGRRWTAFATGPTQRVESVGDLEMAATLPSLAPDPSVSEQRGGLFRLRPMILSGRWIEAL